MNTNDSIAERLASFAGEVPARLPVVALSPCGVEIAEQRMQRLISSIGDCCLEHLDRGDSVRKQDRTLLRMTNGRRAIAYHASGALEYHGGVEPMRELFEEPAAAARSTEALKGIADRLSLHYWVGRDERLDFERLWQIKAAAADPRGKQAESVVCRTVGAFRHVVNGVPVLGAASAVAQLTGKGTIDVLRMHVRATTNETIDDVATISPIDAALSAVGHAERLVPGGKVRFADIVEPTDFTFGYFSAGKRLTQRALAPVYVATFRSGGRDERDESMNHLIVVNASRREYLELCQIGRDPTARLRRAG